MLDFGARGVGGGDYYLGGAGQYVGGPTSFPTAAGRSLIATAVLWPPPSGAGAATVVLGTIVTP